MNESNGCGASVVREDYDLCAIGLLDGPEADEIESHLARQCPSCIEGIREGHRFWYSFGVAQAAEMPGAPRRALRGRLLNGVRRDGASLTWGFFPLTWPVAANAAMAAGLVATTWYAFQQRSVTELPVPGIDPSTVTRLEGEVRSLRERAEAAERAGRQTAFPTPAPVPVRVEDPAVRQALETARAQLRETLDRLTEEQARARRIESELAAERTQLATVRRSLEEAERLAGGLPAERARATAREQEILVLNTRIQQLERDNVRYRETLLRLRGDLDRNIRMAAFLSSPSLQMVKLRATGTGKQALGQAFVVDGQRLVFYASNMPALAPGRTYQLWVLRGKAPAIVSGGLFAGNLGQENALEFTNAEILRDVRGLAVTDEPQGGSPGPTGNKFLVGTLRPM